MSRRWQARCFLAAGLLGGLAACGPADPGAVDVSRERRAVPVEEVLIDGRPDPATLADEQVLLRGNGEEPQTLDPHRAEGVPAAHILRDLFEGLVTEAPDGTLVPGAAARWDISRDARTYTFFLRRDARWSNGDPLTGEDFLYGLRRCADPATASSHASMLLPIENARDVISGRLPPDALGVNLLDAYTLQIVLNHPTPYFLSVLAHACAYPLHRASVEEAGERFARTGELVSNGAFKLRRWAIRSVVELERNPNYHAAAETLLDRVLYLPVEDQSAEINMFRAGELDWTYEVPNNQFDWLRRNYPAELVISPWLGSYFFGFNLTREPFIENPALRRALVLAIDREVITAKVTQFGELPSFTLVPPGIEGYEPAAPDYAAWTQAEREQEAQRLYAEAGYSADRPLRVEIRFNTSENHKKVALAIASMWKQVLGATTILVNEEWKVFLQNRAQKVLTEVFRAGWISDYNDPLSFLELFRTGHGRNDFGFADETYDSLLDEIAQERIPARRRRLMEAAETQVLEASPIIPVYTYVTKRLVDRHVRGWQNNVMDHHYSRYLYKLRSAERSASARAEATGSAPPKASPDPEEVDRASDREAELEMEGEAE